MRLGNLSVMTPFSKEIIDTDTKRKIKIPTIDPYDGTTDPQDHLAAYKAQMSVQMGCEAVWCKFFPTTLKGIAQIWFTNLPNGSITKFTELSSLFTQHFIAKKEAKEDKSSSDVHQPRGDTNA